MAMANIDQGFQISQGTLCVVSHAKLQEQVQGAEKAWSNKDAEPKHKISVDIAEVSEIITIMIVSLEPGENWHHSETSSKRCIGNQSK